MALSCKNRSWSLCLCNNIYEWNNRRCKAVYCPDDDSSPLPLFPINLLYFRDQKCQCNIELAVKSSAPLW
ncbi:unnamed protein product [Cylicocyclus nassatus]|uniref:Uncharacterized protein n=1 Tax=Cylicocyclus nassatus TaxID=53992 RepID=A0AA36DP12_CYLNA|nr:unnamed protein product [Cylicocyclus nassatus]